MGERLPSNTPTQPDASFLPTRRDVDPYYQFSETHQALQTLTDCGFLTKMSDLRLYHGRAGDPEEDHPWRVDPAFDNSGNNTGHRNINKIAALSTGDYGVARDFAKARARGRKAAMVHRILSDDGDASIISSDFDWDDLDSDQKSEFRKAIAATLPGALRAAPLGFDEKELLDGLRPRDLITEDHGLAFEEEIKASAAKFGLGFSVAWRISSARNTRQIIKNRPYLAHKLTSAFRDRSDYITLYLPNERGVEVEHSLPISREYLANWFRQAHIVGVQTPVYSATLKRDLDNYILFDTEKINTSEAIEAKRRVIKRRLGQIALSMSDHRAEYRANKEPAKSSLGVILSDNLYIQPHEIIQLAKRDPKYKKIFESTTGNREGYTLEEHTETVLRLFDENYADQLPAAVLPVMRMALLVHDLGKPEAARKGEKSHQKSYNLAEAKSFMRENAVDKPTRKLILAMIGEGMEFTDRWMVRGDEYVRGDFYQFCKQTMQDYLDVPEVDSATVTGFRHLLEILQNCDSGAYTSMGTTHSPQTKVTYRNLEAFNDSFEDFRGLTGRRVRLRSSAENLF